jgi:hypothetical protein
VGSLTGVDTAGAMDRQSCRNTCWDSHLLRLDWTLPSLSGYDCAFWPDIAKGTAC